MTQGPENSAETNVRQRDSEGRKVLSAAGIGLEIVACVPVTVVQVRHRGGDH